MRKIFFPIIIVILWNLPCLAQGYISISNRKVTLSVTVKSTSLLADTLKWNSPNRFGTMPDKLITDAGFAIDLIYTGWIAPRMQNNSQNRLLLTQKDFEVKDSKAEKFENGSRIVISLKSKSTTISAKIVYTLDNDKFYVRKAITVYDPIFGSHFLHAIRTAYGKVSLAENMQGKQEVAIRVEGGSEYESIGNESESKDITATVLKDGGYGQPCVIKGKNSSAFFAMEYPSAENKISKTNHGLMLDCSRTYGDNVDSIGITSDGFVMALASDTYIKKWYWDYVSDIRVAPAKPYTLYNSWYDLRSVEYPKVPEQHWMNEENVSRLIGKVHENMTVKNGIKVDAFVLDDGWDVYKSDWVLRDKQFPNGLKPLAEKLAANGTALGAWFGPIGGYSFRMQRINWMMQHGYEGLGKEYEYCGAYLCIGGDKYSELFKKRAVDMVVKQGVNYFKWDGMIFSCNAPDHGHKTGFYSVPSILDRFGGICDAVREAKPDVFLNITTGSWLSPYWLRYANQIWMDGADYAFANVPSLSSRDNAITYRDFVLYDDLKVKDLWFPVSNLMTHGIIKGKLDHVGEDNEPLDKLTDDAMLYVARGISMYELYISPDILKDSEWKAIASALKWGRDRFPILATTEMIGGNPTMGEPYGYAHLKGNKGVFAMRNPGVEIASTMLELLPEYGMDVDAASLVIEQVYPYHYIFPDLYSAGAKIPIKLDGFETAIYEIYPLSEANDLLIAGAILGDKTFNANNETVNILGSIGKVRILNPEVITHDSKLIDVSTIKIIKSQAINVVSAVKEQLKKTSTIKIDVDVPSDIETPNLGLLFRMAEGSTSDFPKMDITIDGKAVTVETQKQKGSWMWKLIPVKAGKNSILVTIPETTEKLKGSVELWSFGFSKEESTSVSFELKEKPTERPQAPNPWPDGTIKVTSKLKVLSL